MMSGWPKICKLAHASLGEHSDKRLKLAQLLGGELGVFLTWSSSSSRMSRHLGVDVKVIQTPLSIFCI